MIMKVMSVMVEYCLIIVCRWCLCVNGLRKISVRRLLSYIVVLVMCSMSDMIVVL